MLKVRLSVLALAGVCLAAESHAETVAEDFSTNPLTRGWQAFGDTNLFAWNAVNQNLEVTWDSSQTNSFFYLPLGAVLSKGDDFSLAFDLQLSEFAAGINPDQPYSFPVTVGLINLQEAQQPEFMRGTGTNTPDLVEFAFFPDPGGAWMYGPSISPVVVDSVGANPFADWAFGYGGLSLTTSDTFHIQLTYTATNQTLHTTITRNGTEDFGPVYDAVLPAGFQDFHVDHLAVYSYSGAVQPVDFPGSIFARGTVDNFTVTLPPPLARLTGGFSNGLWQAQFTSHTNRVYTLQRTVDFQTWTIAGAPTPGTGTNLVLQDTNPPAAKAFYRVRADQP